MLYTDHAIKRMKQRGISNKAVEVLCSFGVEQSDNHGANIIFLTKKIINTIKKKVPAHLYHYFCEKRIYAVEKDGLIITVGHRNKKINR